MLLDYIHNLLTPRPRSNLWTRLVAVATSLAEMVLPGKLTEKIGLLLNQGAQVATGIDSVPVAISNIAHRAAETTAASGVRSTTIALDGVNRVLQGTADLGDVLAIPASIDYAVESFDNAVTLGKIKAQLPNIESTSTEKGLKK